MTAKPKPPVLGDTPRPKLPPQMVRALADWEKANPDMKPPTKTRVPQRPEWRDASGEDEDRT